MTAQRWWVQLAARWLARVDGVNGQLRLLFLAMTGYGIVLQTLAQYGLGGYALEVLAVSGVVLVAYTYYYNEGGVRNQVSRDRNDLQGNFSGPGNMIDDVLIGLAVFSAVHQREPTDEEVAEIISAVQAQWEEYRTGLPDDLLNDT
jgi:hypothetical protein